MIWKKLSLGVPAWALRFNFVKDEVYMFKFIFCLYFFFNTALNLNFH